MAAFNAQEYHPLVHLEEVNVASGEENESELYKQRSRVYRFDEEAKEWKQRGTGDVRFLQHKETKLVRVVLREEKTLKLRLNHIVMPGFELQQNLGSDRAWTWAALDYSLSDEETEPRVWTFAIKFRTPEIAEAYKSKYIDCQAMNAATMKADKKEKEEPKKKEEVEEVKEEAPVEAEKEKPAEAEKEAAKKEEAAAEEKPAVAEEPVEAKKE